MSAATQRAEDETPTAENEGGTGFMVSPISGARCPTGAHPGNTGGKPGRSGRPASAVRLACRDAFDERIPQLMMIADGAVQLTETCPKCGHKGAATALPVTDTSDILRAHDMLGKYGGLEREGLLSLDAVEESLRAQGRIIRETLDATTAAKLLARLSAEAWG